MLEKFDPMAGDEAEIIWSKKKKALESITERMLHMDEMEVPTRTLTETIAEEPVTMYLSRPYPTWQYVPPWDTTTTTGTGWARTVWTTNFRREPS